MSTGNKPLKRSIIDAQPIDLPEFIEPIILAEMIRAICDRLNKNRWARVTDVSRMFMVVGQLERVHAQMHPERVRYISPLDAPKPPKVKEIVEGPESLGSKQAEPLKTSADEILQRLMAVATDRAAVLMVDDDPVMTQ
jgi:hypothetical protein